MLSFSAYGSEEQKQDEDSLKFVTSLKEVYDLHSKNKKPILLYAYDSTWSCYCKVMELAKTSGSLVDIKDDFIIAYIDYAARAESIPSRYEVYPTEIHVIQSMGVWGPEGKGSSYYFKGVKAKIKDPRKIKSVKMLIYIYMEETVTSPKKAEQDTAPNR